MDLLGEVIYHALMLLGLGVVAFFWILGMLAAINIINIAFPNGLRKAPPLLPSPRIPWKSLNRIRSEDVRTAFRFTLLLLTLVTVLALAHWYFFE